MTRPATSAHDALSGDAAAGERRPLAGLRVIDLSQVVSGAVTTMLMADFGAEVVKVEPIDGEPYRKSGYEIAGEAGATNLNILRYTRGKKSIALDLKSDAGKEVFRELVAGADILVENFRPGVLGRLGFDRETLERINPDLVYTSVSGFGSDDLFPSPFRDRPAYAIITEAMAGLTHLAGDGEGPPVWMGFAMADIFAGTLAFTGTVLALLQKQGEQQRPGGRRIDISMYDAGLLMNDLAIAAYSVAGENLGPGQYLLQSPWGPFETSDGYVVIAVLMQDQWVRLAKIVGRPELAEDERLASGIERSRHHDELVAPAIEAWCRTRTKEECAEILNGNGVPAAPVNTAAEIMSCPQAAAREMLIDVDNAVTGQVRLVGNPIKMDGVGAGAADHIPQLGENTIEVLTEILGRSADEVDELVRDNVVAAPRAAAGAVDRG